MLMVVRHPKEEDRVMEEWLRVGEAAECLGIAESTVYRRAERGELRKRKIGKVTEFCIEDKPADHELKAEIMGRDEVILTLEAQVEALKASIAQKDDLIRQLTHQLKTNQRLVNSRLSVSFSMRRRSSSSTSRIGAPKLSAGSA